MIERFIMMLVLYCQNSNWCRYILKNIAFQNVVSLKKCCWSKYSNWRNILTVLLILKKCVTTQNKIGIWVAKAHVWSQKILLLCRIHLANSCLNGSYVNDFIYQQPQHAKRGKRTTVAMVFRRNHLIQKLANCYTNVEEPLYEDDQKLLPPKAVWFVYLNLTLKRKIPRNTATYSILFARTQPKTAFA
jgi:hypothetical protein